jgi:hypothetical protein
MKDQNKTPKKHAAALEIVYTMTIVWNVTKQNIKVDGPLESKSVCFKMLEDAEKCILNFKKAEPAEVKA